jgi:hypothetical protein
MGRTQPPDLATYEKLIDPAVIPNRDSERRN